MSSLLPATANSFAASAVIDKRVDGFLQHSLFVADDDLGRAEFYKFFKTVVSVDNASVKVVKVGSRESAAVELYHRTEFGRDYGQNVQYHPFGTVAALSERLYDFKTFDRT